MEKDLILTVDAGTSACKCAAFHVGGTLAAAAREPHPTAYPRPSWSEQDVESIRDGAIRGIRAVLREVAPERIVCVGLTGTMNGCLPVDRDGTPLHPNVIHSDSRAAAEAEGIGRAIPHDEFYRLTGNRIDNHYTLPKILWFRDRLPDVYRRTRHFLNIKDYLFGCLTGRFGVTDFSDASLTIALDIRKKRWADGLLAELGVDPSTLPEIRKGTDASERVSPSASRATGLIEGTPVSVGGGDGACAARGAGIRAAGEAYACIGSSAWVGQLSVAPAIDRERRIFNYLDMDGEAYHVCGTAQCGCEASDWAIRNLIRDDRDGSEGSIRYAEELARGVPAGSEGVLYFPSLMGERTPHWDPRTRGCLFGFTLYHDRAHVARAAYEGFAYALRQCSDAMLDHGLRAHSMRLIGGGAKSALWPEILAAVMRLRTTVHATPDEATSLGAAFTAGIGVGIYPDYARCAELVGDASRHEARADWADAYDRYYEVFRSMYGRFKPLFDGLDSIGLGARAES